MMNTYKKITALILAFMLVFVSAFGTGSMVYAGGVGDEGPYGKPIASADFRVDFNRNGYYPATFRYAMEKMELVVQFEDGTSETISHWYPNNGGYDGTDYAFVGTGMQSFDQYYFRLYDLDDQPADPNDISDLKPATFTENVVSIGTFTWLITRNDETKPLTGITSPGITILDPSDVTQNASGSAAGFFAPESYQFEETWYKLDDLTAGQSYVFNVTDWNDTEGTFFAGIWYKDGNANEVFNLSDGFDRGSVGSSFTYTAQANETPYLVIGEMQDYIAKKGTIAWQQKRELSSIQLQPAATYQVWNDDILKMPVKLNYADGTSSTEGDWKHENIDMSGNYDYVDGYSMTTSNGDTLYLAKYHNNVWSTVSYDSYIEPGTTNWRVIVKDNSGISDDASVTIAAPPASTLRLEDGYYEDFSVKAGKDAFFQCTTEKDEVIEIINNGNQDLYAYTYVQPQGTSFWELRQSELVSPGRPSTQNVKSGSRILFILSGKGSSGSGSIGIYSVGQTGSATVPAVTIAQGDYGAWAKLPIKVHFVNAEGKSVGTQTFADWHGDIGLRNTGYAETKYQEMLYYQVFKDGKLIEVPFLSEEMLAILADQTDDEVKNNILLECGFRGGVAGLNLAAGTYTVKVYLNQITDHTLIGSGTITVTASSKPDEQNKPTCKVHTWGKGTVKQKATMKASGKESFACTSCGATKMKSIAKIKSVKLSKGTYIYDGKNKVPKVVVKDGNGKTISKAYYTVKMPSKRSLVGKYSCKVTFKGKYQGTKTLYLTVNPKATAIKKKPVAAKKAFTVKWNKATKQTSGYEIMYSTSKKFTKQTSRSVIIKKNTTTSKKISKLKAKKTYYVKVRTYKTVKGKKYYSSWSAVKSVKTR